MIAMLVNPTFPGTESVTNDVQGRRTLGLELKVVNATSEHDFDPAFAISGCRLVRLITATIHSSSAEAIDLSLGGPPCNPSNLSISGVCRGRWPDELRNLSRWISPGRHLRRSDSQRREPSDLPVVQPAKFELVINLKTAKALGLDVPRVLRARRRGDRMMRRREFITLLGGAAAAWPLAARAQQPAMPVVGFLYSQSPEVLSEMLRRFRQGLQETGFVEGDNVTIEYRWAENQTDRLPALAVDLVRRQVAVIVAMDTPSALVAKAATGTITIVFNTGSDPVRDGLVASLARPGGNLTGVNFFAADLAAKRLGLLRELVPGAVRIAVLVNPAHASIAEATLRDVEVAARDIGVKVEVLNASTAREIGEAFSALARDRPDALLVGSGPFINARRVQLALLAVRYGIPAIYTGRTYVEAGGLISYGASLPAAWHQAGVYTGRILKGAKASDLPVLQASKFEMVINTETARMLGLTVPPSLLATADEVIE